MGKKLEFRYCDKVRYAECDMHQHLNHAKYFFYFEQARVEYFQKLGFSITSDYKSIPFIVAAAHCDYKAPLHLNDEISVDTGITEFGTKSFKMEYEMRNGKTGEVAAVAYTVLVMFDYEKMESVAVSDSFKQKVEGLRNA